MRASLAAHESWAKTEDRGARTAAGTAASMARFDKIVDPDGKLTPAERAKRAENARRANFQRMAYLSARARQRRRNPIDGNDA
ncbi:hypothetical protein A5686_06400 [Mycobacterium sp. E2479]|nr:hypothetical protein A5686_06400 [Mycobacterium sp. E2479]